MRTHGAPRCRAYCLPSVRHGPGANGSPPARRGVTSRGDHHPLTSPIPWSLWGKGSSETEFMPDLEPPAPPFLCTKTTGSECQRSIPSPGPPQSHAVSWCSPACLGGDSLPTRCLGLGLPSGHFYSTEWEGWGPAPNRPSPSTPRVCPAASPGCRRPSRRWAPGGSSCPRSPVLGQSPKPTPTAGCGDSLLPAEPEREIQ